MPASLTFYDAWVIALALLVALSFFLLGARRLLKRFFPAIWRLIALDTPALNPPCPLCGNESTIVTRLHAPSTYRCFPCDLLVGPVRR